MSLDPSEPIPRARARSRRRRRDGSSVARMGRRLIFLPSRFFSGRAESLPNHILAANAPLPPQLLTANQSASIEFCRARVARSHQREMQMKPISLDFLLSMRTQSQLSAARRTRSPVGVRMKFSPSEDARLARARDQSAAGDRARRQSANYFFENAGSLSACGPHLCLALGCNSWLTALCEKTGRSPGHRPPAVVRVSSLPRDPADATPHRARHRHAREDIDDPLGRRVTVRHQRRWVPLRRGPVAGKKQALRGATSAEE